MKPYRYVALAGAIVTILVLCSSCGQMFMAKWPPADDPLKGWSSWAEWDEPAKHHPLDKAIKDDYQNYLHAHPSNPIGAPVFYEDGTGQHAVKIEIETYDRDEIVYIFLYDKTNKRTKLMEFFAGHTSC